VATRQLGKTLIAASGRIPIDRFPPDLKIAAVVRAAPIFALTGKFGFGKL
jgi:hypothetical protein